LGGRGENWANEQTTDSGNKTSGQGERGKKRFPGLSRCLDLGKKRGGKPDNRPALMVETLQIEKGEGETQGFLGGQKGGG